MLTASGIHWLGLVLALAVASPHRCIQSCGDGTPGGLVVCWAQLDDAGDCRGDDRLPLPTTGRGVACWQRATADATARCIAAVGDRGSLARRPYCACWLEPAL